MRGWLLDTNVIASLSALNGAPTVKAWAASQDEADLYISVLTLAEYDKGIHQLAAEDPARGRHRAHRDALERRFAGRVLPLSDAAVRRWGAISGRTRRDTGQAPPVIDTLLAASAVEASLYLATRNIRDFLNSGAALFNPWSDDPAAFPLTPPPRRHR